MKKSLSRLTLALACFTLAAAAHAQVSVKDAWVRATVPQQKATGAFMQLTATRDVRLVSVSTPAAGVAEIHEMALDNNVMKMRAVPGLDLPAGKVVELKPGGYHLMLMDLKAPVNVGDVVPVTLVLEGKDGQRETLEIKATARALGATMPSGHADHGAMMH